MFFHPLVPLPRLGGRILACRKCGTPVASTEARISVLDRPVQSTYVNPQGDACEIVTLDEAENLLAADFVTEEHSWFPGYAWRPVGCAKCRLHLGWRYEASDPDARPETFYGLLVPWLREQARPAS